MSLRRHLMVMTALLGLSAPAWSNPAPLRLSPDEVAHARALALPEQPRAPADPSNRFADDPRAAQFGQALFFDVRLSANGQVSCASCHRPESAFADDQAFSRGLGVTTRNTPTLLGSGWSRWFFWDGRSDTHWGQALSPLLDPAEQGLTRTELVATVRRHHQAQYEAVFGRLPAVPTARPAGPEGTPQAQAAWRELTARQRQAIDRVLANLGKAFAAFQRTLHPAPARFDRFARALADGRDAEAQRIFNRDEVQGFRLFVGSARCIQCHNGPMFSNYQFHNTGLHDTDPVEHQGHKRGMALARASDFGCLGPHSDDSRQCPSRFVGLSRDMVAGAFKTPTLRNVARTAPYMRTGELATLDDVIAHYDAGSRTPGRAGVIGNELPRLFLSRQERDQLKAFLMTLTSAPPAPGADS